MRLVVSVLIASACLLYSQEISRRSPPRVIHSAVPEYSKEARDAKLEGTVVLSTVVGVDGLPSEIKVIRGLGKGLEEKAVECLEKWRFSPALNHGEPIPGKVTIEVNFSLAQPGPVHC